MESMQPLTVVLPSLLLEEFPFSLITSARRFIVCRVSMFFLLRLSLGTRTFGFTRVILGGSGRSC